MPVNNRPHEGITTAHTWRYDITGVDTCPRKAAQMDVRVQLHTGVGLQTGALENYSRTHGGVVSALKVY